DSDRSHPEFEESPFDIEIRLLGPIDVAGVRSPIERGKSIELLAYLATHRSGVDADTLITALWPERRPSDQTIWSTTAAAHRALGNGPDGTPLLPVVAGGGIGIYRLPPVVVSDYERLVARLKCAKTA